jgi:diguanylate cyclase (GGDEF)-like protein
LKRRNESKLERVQRIAGWIFAAFVVFFSTADFTMMVPILALLFGYNFYRSLREVYKAWKFNEPGALWILVGLISIGIAMLMQPLSYTLHNEARIAIQVSIVIFVFLQSQFIGLRFKTALNESRFLSEHLQEEIARKTRDLRAQQKEIYSRSYFENQLEIEWSRCQREQSSIALILFDLDGSKLINRDFGRSAGDQWLYHFAHLLGAHVRRQTDIAARYGGDEFVLLLPGCDMFEANLIAEKFLQDVQSSTLKLGDAELSFSVTAGLQAIVPNEDISATEDLVNRAVVALHQAKDTQRGQVRIYKPNRSASTDDAAPKQ